MLKDRKAVAKAVASVSLGKPVFSYTVQDVSLLKTTSALSSIQKHAFKAAKCNDCGTKLVSNLKAPFCMTCSSDNVSVSDANEVMAPKDEECSALTCSSCKHTSVFTDAVIAAAGHKVSCTFCGTEMKGATEIAAPDDFVEVEGGHGSQELHVEKNPGEKPKETSRKVSHKMKANELLNIPAETGDSPNNIVIPSGANESPSVSLNDEDDAIVDPVAVDQDLEVLDSIDSDLELEMSNTEDNPGSELPIEGNGNSLAGPTGSAPDLDTEDSLISSSDDDSEFEPISEEATAEAEETEEPKDEEATFDEGEPLSDVLKLDNTEASVAFVANASAKRLVAMKGSVAIAYLSTDKATVSAKALFSNDFASTASRLIKNRGLRQGLASLGFAFVRVPVLTEASVKAQIAAKDKTTAATLAKERAAFQESMEVASAGLARNQWKGHKNPLQLAIASVLSQVGVQRPNEVARRVVLKSNAEYIAQLMAVTDKLLSAGPAVRKQFLASMSLLKADSDDLDISIDEPQLGDTESDEDLVDNITSSQTVARFMRPTSERSRATASQLNAIDKLRSSTFGFGSTSR